MASIRAFSATSVAFVIAMGFSWLHRPSLLAFWLSPLVDQVPLDQPALHSQTGFALAMFEVTLATALLLTYPIFSAEAWIVLCRAIRREDARRLAVPFAAVSAGVIALAFWLIRQIPVSTFVIPL